MPSLSLTQVAELKRKVDDQASKLTDQASKLADQASRLATLERLLRNHPQDNEPPLPPTMGPDLHVSKPHQWPCADRQSYAGGGGSLGGAGAGGAG